MRIYICGPITGMPDNNRPAFLDCAAYLRKTGLQVVNPLEFPREDPVKPWLFYMKKAVSAMMTCDAVYALHGCSMSKGASIELQLANNLGMQVFYQPPDIVRAYRHDLTHPFAANSHADPTQRKADPGSL